MVRIATADVAVEADTAPFIADLEKLKVIVEKFDKLSVAVHAKLAKGTRASLQAQLKALAPPLTVNVKAKLTGLGELRKLLASHASILGEENQLNAALQEEAKARKEVANAASAQSRATTAGLNAERAALALESQRLRLERQREQAAARQAKLLEQQAAAVGSQIRGFRDLATRARAFTQELVFSKDAFNAIKGETLLTTLQNVFQKAIQLRSTATQLGTIFATGFAAAAQGTGALISGLGRVISSVGVLAGIGLITIGVKVLLKNDAEVQASLQNLKTTFTNVFTNAAQSLKPVITGFFDDIGTGLKAQEGAFKGFFDKVSGPLGQVGKVFSNFLASEQFTNFINKAGDATAGFLTKLADKLPSIINGFIRVGQTIVAAGKRIREAFGPGVLSGLSFDKVVNGINAVTDALVKAGPGIRAFKTAFGQFLDGVGAGLKNVLATIGTAGPALFGALGPIAKAVATDIGVVISALIRFASVVLPTAQAGIITFSDTFSKNLSKALDILAKPLGDTIKNITELGTKLSPLLPILAQLAADLEPVISAVVRFGIAISPAVIELAKFIEKFAAGAAGPLKIFGDIIVTVAGFLSKVFTPILKFLNDHGITDFLGKIAGTALAVLIAVAAFKKLTGILGIFGKAEKGKTAALLAENAAMGKGSKLVRLFKAALTTLGDAARTVGRFFKNLIPENVLTKLSSIGTKLLDQIKNPFTAIRLQLINLGEAFSKIGSKIGGAFEGIGGKIAGFFGDIGAKIKAPFAAVGDFFSGLGGKIVNAFSGIGGKIAGFFGDIGGKIGKFFEPVLTFFKGIGSKIAGAFKGLKIGSIFGDIAKVAGPFEGILGTAGRLLGTFGRFLGPLGIIITLILEWRTIFDLIKAQIENFKTTIAGLVAGFSKIGEGIKKIFSGDFFGGLKDIGSGLLKILTTVITSAFTSLKNVASALWTILWHTLESIPILGGLFTKLHALISKGFDFLKGIFTSAGSFFSTVWNGLVAGASAAWNFIKAVFSPVLSFFGSVFSGIGTVISGVWDFIKSIFSAGVSFIGTIISGIVQFFSNPIEGIKTIISGAWDFIKSVFSAGVAFIGSVFSGIGTIVSGVWDFITSIFSAGVSIIGSILSGIGSFFSAAFSVVSSIVSGVFDFISGIISGFVSGIGSALSGIGGFFSSAFDTVKSVVSGAIDFVKGIISGVVETVSKIADKIKSIFSSSDNSAAAAPAPQVDQAAVNAAADQVRKQSEAILAALKELAPKVQAELANVTAIISAGFANLGTTIGTQTVGIATTVGAALTGLATQLTTTMATLATTLLTQLVTLATTLTTTLTTTIAAALTNLTTSFTTVGAGLTAAFTAIFADLGNQATAFFSVALPATVLNGTAALQANLTSGLTTAFQGAFAAIGPVIDGAMAAAFANASGAASAGMGGIVDAINQGVGAIQAAFAPLQSQIPQTISDAFNQAVAKAQDGVNNLVKAVQDGAARITALGQSYFDAGATIGQRLADGMNSKVQAVHDAAVALAGAAATKFPASPAKEGPLSGKGDPLRSGGVIVDRLIAGIESRRAALASTIDQLAGTIHEGAARAGIDVNLPSGNAAITNVVDAIRRGQDPLAAALDRLTAQLGQQNLSASVAKGMQIGLANAAGPAAGTALVGRFDKSIKGSILKQDTQASFGGNGSTQSNLVQIRPGAVNLTLAGIKDPKSFLDELSKELLTMVKGH